MSKADEMFEKLGYRKDVIITYTLVIHSHQFDITFDSVFKEFIIRESFYDEVGNYQSNNIDINDTSLEVTEAINEKCKELRMDGGIEYGYSKIYGFKRLDYTRNSICYSKYNICHLLCNKEKIKDLEDNMILFTNDKEKFNRYKYARDILGKLLEEE